MTTFTPPPAGWYIDPSEPTQRRRWDGRGWTDDIMEGSHDADRFPPFAGFDSPTLGRPTWEDFDYAGRRPSIPRGTVIRTAAAVIVAAAVIAGIVAAVISGSHGISDGRTAAQHSADDARNFIAPLKTDARAASEDTRSLVVEAFRTTRYDDLVQLASDSDTLHGHLTDYRSACLGAPGSYKDDESAFVDAENDLKNAVGAIHTWTATPNAANDASWQDQMASAIAHWNVAVTKLWREAKAGTPPTIELPTSV